MFFRGVLARLFASRINVAGGNDFLKKVNLVTVVARRATIAWCVYRCAKVIVAQSAQIIIWVIVGGRGTLIGPIVGCIGIQWLTTALGANQPSGGPDWWAKIFANAPLILGIILIASIVGTYCMLSTNV